MVNSRSRLVAAGFLILFIAVVVFGYSALQKIRLDESGSDFAINIAQQVYSSGTIEPMVAAAHPELTRRMTSPQWQSMLDSQLRTLGAMTAMTEIRGEAAVPMVTYPGQLISASYEIDIQFDSSLNTLFIELTRESSNWRITAFRLDAPLLYD